MNENIATIFALPTLEDVAQNYRNYITSQNSLINPNVPNTDFYLKSFGIAGISTGIVGDMSSYFINMFPQYKTGIFLDIGLQAAGLPPRFPATYASAILGTVSPPSSPFTVQAGMQLNEPITNTIFQILTTQLILTTDAISYNNIASVCTIIGSGNQLAPGTVLFFATPPIDDDTNPVLSLTVKSSVSGTDVESDDQANLRLLEASQIPRSGSRITDYFYYGLDANVYPVPETINWVLTLPNNQFLSANYNFGVFGLSGTGITDAILDKGIINNNYVLFDRSISAGTISAIETSIRIQQLINANPYVDSIGTQFLPTYLLPYIQVKVILQVGFDLSSVIKINTTDPHNAVISITVEQLIKREVRRAICQQPYGANQTYSASGAITSSTIFTSSIEDQLGYALGTAQYQGIYATVLLDRIIEINDGTGTYLPTNIILSPGGFQTNNGIPNPPPATTGGGYPLLWIYDITDNTTVGYNNILVVAT